MSTVIFEEATINNKFADLLNMYGIECYPQIILPGSKKPDIMIFIDGIRIIIEGRFQNLQNLEADAKRRIKNGLCEVSVALLYDSSLKECSRNEKLIEKLKTVNYNGTFFYRVNGDIYEQKFNSWTIDEFASSLGNIISLLVKEDKIEEVVEKIEAEFSKIIKSLDNTPLWFDREKKLTLLERIKYILSIDKNIQNLNEKELFYIVFFIIFDALLFHELIADINPQIKKITSQTSPENFRQFLITEWGKILKIDYQPIFSLAFEILKQLTTVDHIDLLLFDIKKNCT